MHIAAKSLIFAATTVTALGGCAEPALDHAPTRGDRNVLAFSYHTPRGTFGVTEQLVVGANVELRVTEDQPASGNWDFGLNHPTYGLIDLERDYLHRAPMSIEFAFGSPRVSATATAPFENQVVAMADGGRIDYAVLRAATPWAFKGSVLQLYRAVAGEPSSLSVPYVDHDGSELVGALQLSVKSNYGFLPFVPMRPESFVQARPCGDLEFVAPSPGRLELTFVGPDGALLQHNTEVLPPSDIVAANIKVVDQDVVQAEFTTRDGAVVIGPRCTWQLSDNRASADQLGCGGTYFFGNLGLGRPLVATCIFDGRVMGTVSVQGQR